MSMSLSLFNRIGLLVCRMYGDEVPGYTPVEKWCLKNSRLCSADEIIVAAVVESFAKSYEDWSLKMNDNYESFPSREIIPVDCNRFEIDSRLTNSKKGFKIYWKYQNLRGTSSRRFHMFVNNVSMTDEAAKVIQEAFYRIKRKKDEVKAAARKAKADMERNEAAWNLAETLLGMKRNEHGALVPVNTVVEDIGIRAVDKPCGSLDPECDCEICLA